MKRLAWSYAVFLILFSFSAVIFAQTKIDENNDGGVRPEFCERCHGIKGFTDNPNMPRLAGQNKGYLVKQLKNFRKGVRRSTPMRQVTLTLNDEDIEQLATYFSQIVISLND